MKCSMEDCSYNKEKQCQAKEVDELSNSEGCMSENCPSFKPKKSKQS